MLITQKTTNINNVKSKPIFTGAFKLKINSEESFTKAQAFLNKDLSYGNKWKDWGVRSVTRIGNGENNYASFIIATVKNKHEFMKKLLSSYGLSFEEHNLPLPKSKDKLRHYIRNISWENTNT